MARRLCVVATCNLNQWSLDFDGNLERIKRSIDQARRANASYRVGPELEVTGFGCEDHFLERDTVRHSWECLKDLVENGYTENIVCDIGMPVHYRGHTFTHPSFSREECTYNCRVLLLNRRVLLIRPKISMANDGNYREKRYFTPWQAGRLVQEYRLPSVLDGICSSAFCPFGDAALFFNDGSLGCEICEELFTPNARVHQLRLAGVEIISNGSGSLHEVKKLSMKLERMQSITKSWGGVYLYANQKGCDGGDLYYDGSACIVKNGRVVGQGSQFGLDEVEVITACVDLDDVHSASLSSFRDQSSQAEEIHKIHIDFHLCCSTATTLKTSPEFEPRIYDPEEELVLGPACWLWDYMRRSGAAGYLLPLSGGADSSATAAIVGAMCQKVVAECADGNERVKAEAMRVGRYEDGECITNAREFANRVFATIYQATENSSSQTRQRAASLAEEIGSYHVNVNIDGAVSAVVQVFSLFSQRTPRFQAMGGTAREDLALQNIQARLRMVIAFSFSQLLQWFRGRDGFLLVLASANADETLRGYMTKYDCSSGDLNPIGSFNKADVNRVLKWGAAHLGYPSLANVLTAAPTAELRPIVEGVPEQVDEDEMKMTYSELEVYGKLRREQRCGPVSMFQKLQSLWSDRLSPSEIAAKVKSFFIYYSINRHKTTTLTPSYHATGYAVDDRRYDHRPFLYRTQWRWQFQQIDDLAHTADVEP